MKPDRLADLEAAILAEEAARKALRAASEHVAELVRALQSEGVPSATLAGRVARVYGVQPTVAARQRIASRLRKRVSRVTHRHGFFNTAHSDNESSGVPCDGTEASMGKLVKRTVVTEEFVESAEDSDVEAEEESDESDETDEDDDDDAEGKPAARRGSRSARR